MWELAYKESWALKNWCFWTVVLEKTLESPLDCKEIQPVRPKGDQSWVFIGRTDAEAETPILWPPDAKSWLIGKDPDAGKDWRQEGKGMTEVKMVGWHHRLNGHGFGWTPGVGDGQGGLACCGSWGHKESDTTEQLNWTEHHCFYLNVLSAHLLASLSLLLLIYWELSESTSFHMKFPCTSGLRSPFQLWCITECQALSKVLGLPWRAELRTSGLLGAPSLAAASHSQSDPLIDIIFLVL